MYKNDKDMANKDNYLIYEITGGYCDQVRIYNFLLARFRRNPFKYLVLIDLRDYFPPDFHSGKIHTAAEMRELIDIIAKRADTTPETPSRICWLPFTNIPFDDGKKFPITRFTLLPNNIYETYKSNKKYISCNCKESSFPINEHCGLLMGIPPRPLLPIANDIKSLLQPSSLIGRKASQEADKIRALPHTICVHIRHGDYIAYHLGGGRNKTVRRDYYLRAIRKICTQNEWNKCDVFLFSDDLPYIKSLQFNDDAITTHYNESVDLNNMFNDLHRMSACKAFVRSVGYFCWLASQICAFPDPLLISPEESDYIDVNDEPNVTQYSLNRFSVHSPKSPK